MIRTTLGIGRAAVDDSYMATSTVTGNRHNVVRVPRSTDNGLWNALAARVVPVPAAGSGLVVVDMSAFRPRYDAGTPTAA
jgi:hypothetical protein